MEEVYRVCVGLGCVAGDGEGAGGYCFYKKNREKNVSDWDKVLVSWTLVMHLCLHVSELVWRMP